MFGEGRYNTREFLVFTGASLLEDKKTVFVGTGFPIIASMLAQSSKTNSKNQYYKWGNYA